MRAVGRVLIAIAGFVLAVFAATGFLYAARFGLPAAAGGPIGTVELLINGGLAASWIGAAAFLPAVLVVLVTEIGRIRSPIAHLLAGGLIGGAGAMGYGGLAPADERAALLLLAAGFVGGFAYWLVAGRTAGLVGYEPAESGDRAGG